MIAAASFSRNCQSIHRRTLSEEKGGLAVVTAAMINWIRHVRGEYLISLPLCLSRKMDWGVSLKCELTG